MKDKINREVFRIEDQNNAIRFGARFIEANGQEEKWSGEIPDTLSEDQLVGRIITNSEGKEYKINKIIMGNWEGRTHSQNLFWIEGI